MALRPFVRVALWRAARTMSITWRRKGPALCVQGRRGRRGRGGNGGRRDVAAVLTMSGEAVSTARGARGVGVRAQHGRGSAGARPAGVRACGRGNRKEREKGGRKRRKEGERKREKRKRDWEKEKKWEGEKGKRREREGERVGAGRGGDRGRSATRAVFARGEREKKRSRAGANHGGRSRVSDEPSSDPGLDSDPVRVRVLTSNHFYELL
jgi:hypothetical protein